MAGLGAATGLPVPDEDRLSTALDALAEIRDPDAPGWTRRVLTGPDRAARDLVHQWMDAAGLETSIDGCGNVVGIRPGRSSRGGALVTGSHVDTVTGGGRFDGVAGVVGALEAVQILNEAGLALDHDLRVVCFYGEESNDHGLACLGSRAVTGGLSSADLDLPDAYGRPLGRAMEAAGLDTNRALRSTWDRSEMAAFVELHIEQGPILESAGRPIGIVSKIAGIRRFVAEFHGRPDHAGTMPMESRQDACCAAADAVLGVEHVGRGARLVATIGRMSVGPGLPNVVPGRAEVYGEVRSGDRTALAAGAEAIERRLRQAGSARAVDVEVHWLPSDPVTAMGGTVSAAVDGAAADLGYPAITLVSGASHDASLMATVAPTGMIFVPSVDGRSHCPEELTHVADLAVGVHVLAQTLVRLDAVGDPAPAR